MAGFGQHVVIRSQRLAVADAGVQVKHRPGLDGERRVSWQDPRAVAPEADRVLCHPAPDRGAGDGGGQAAGQHLVADVLVADVGDMRPRQRYAEVGGQFAGDGLDLDYQPREEGPAPGRCVATHRARPGDARRSACATWTPPPGGRPAGRHPRRFAAPGRLTARSWPAARPDTAALKCGRVPRPTVLWRAGSFVVWLPLAGERRYGSPPAELRERYYGSKHLAYTAWINLRRRVKSPSPSTTYLATGSLWGDDDA